MMLMTFSTDFFNKPLNTVAGYVIVPFQRGISSVGGWLAARSDELVQIRTLLSENEALKQQVDELTIENTQLQQDKYELNSLQALYKLDKQYEEYEKIGARIIARDSGNWYHSFTIDKGSDDGIMVDMNVIADGGLVGRVISTGPNWAKVTSVISGTFSILQIPSERMAAGIMATAAFFAPLMDTSPVKRLPPVISNLSNSTRSNR